MGRLALSRSAPGRHVGIREVRSDVSATSTAPLAHEAAFDIGQAHVVRPTIRVRDHAMATPKISAAHDDAAQAGLAHLAERNFDLSRHGGRIAWRGQAGRL